MSFSRLEGFAPLSEYAILGDGQSVVLVAADGRLDWWPVPALDSPPVCAAILDPNNGGHVSFAPSGPFEVTRSYVEDTNVLETVFTTESGIIRVTQALNVGQSGRLPWTELATRIEGLSGEVELEWMIVPGNRFGEAKPWVTTFDKTPLIHLGDQNLAVILDEASSYSISSETVRGSVVVFAGQRRMVGIVATDSEPLSLPDVEAIDSRLDRSIDTWRRWSSNVDESGPWGSMVKRSALVLKTLVAEGTGAIAAAATTSLPEAIGGEKNWDYRFSWIRDSSFTLDALIGLGLDEEVHRAVSWLLDTVRRNGEDLRVFYTLKGEIPDSQQTLNVPGYRDSQPVRAGNSAANQIQLGNYGDLFDTVWRYCEAGHLLDDRTGEYLSNLADRCCDHWQTRDSGIWELKDLEHYTISKIGCWVALDRAVRLAGNGQLASRHADRWRYEADEIRRWVQSNCWSAEKMSYTFYAATEKLDAAVLLATRTGFDRGERMVTTIEAIERELGPGPLYYRYSGAGAEEGAFVACTFWMVTALAYMDRIDDACELMTEAVNLANDVGIFSEQIDKSSREFLGNLPQGLSHLALINAANILISRCGDDPDSNEILERS